MVQDIIEGYQAKTYCKGRDKRKCSEYEVDYYGGDYKEAYYGTNSIDKRNALNFKFGKM